MQELFKYCNDASGYRVVTASTCSEEPSFDAMLSAFLSYSGTCQLVGFLVHWRVRSVVAQVPLAELLCTSRVGPASH